MRVHITPENAPNYIFLHTSERKYQQKRRSYSLLISKVHDYFIECNACFSPKSLAASQKQTWNQSNQNFPTWLFREGMLPVVQQTAATAAKKFSSAHIVM